MKPKSFTDAKHYLREIESLVPGYSTIHHVLPHVVASLLPASARVLVVGCGPGHELVALAKALPEGVKIDAIDTELGMVLAAREVVEAAQVTELCVHHSSLAKYQLTKPYDLVVSVLVGHLIPDDGGRADFLHQISTVLRPDAYAVLVDMMHGGEWHPQWCQAYLSWALASGLSPERVEVLRDRLDGGFALLTRARYLEIFDELGLSMHPSFFRCLGVEGLLLQKSGQGEISKQ